MWFGLMLLLAGVVVNVSSAWRHVRVVRGFDVGSPTAARSSTLAVATALLLAAGGLIVAIYFFSARAFQSHVRPAARCLP